MSELAPETLRYQMVVDETEHYVDLHRAGVLLDNGMAPVRIGSLVMSMPSGETRPMSDKDRTDIVRQADDWGDLK